MYVEHFELFYTMSSRYPNTGYGKHQDPNLSQQGSDEQYKVRVFTSEDKC